MTKHNIEELAKWAAETLNGGDFYDKNYYHFKHKEAWEDLIRKLIPKIESANVSSWEGYVDRQSGAFTDQEIQDSQAWK